MLDDAIAGRFGVIVIYALDRFGRDVVQVITALKTLDAAGVKVVPVRGQIDRDTPEGQMMTTIEAAFGEWERAKIKIRTRVGIAGKVRAGKPHGVARFGYATGEDLHWIVRPDEAELATRIYTMRGDDGLSYHAIARKLNEDGARRPATASAGARPKSSRSSSPSTSSATSCTRASGTRASIRRSSKSRSGRRRRR